MRSGATQQIPTAQPELRIFIGGDEYTCHGVSGGNGRIVSVKYDEQIWGGAYTILLDNSDGALTNKTYQGSSVDTRWGFVGQTPSLHPHLWVFSQKQISYEGKVMMELACIDGWGMVAQSKLTLANSYFNQEWQKDENIDGYTLPSGQPIPASLRADIVAHSNVDIQNMLVTLLQAVGLDSVSCSGDTSDPSMQLKPPISISNYISGVRQLLEMTNSYLFWWRFITEEGDPWGASDSSGFREIYSPLDRAVAYSYNQANSFFVNVNEAGLVVPNRIYYWAFNEAGDNFIYGMANDAASQAAIAAGTPVSGYPGEPMILKQDGVISRHYILTPELMVDGRATEATLEGLAEGSLDKIRQERGQGFIVAPMHCSQELLDKVQVTDSRYSPARTITGIVHRMVREYDRGKYQITIYLGGVTTGATQDLGGNYAVPLHEAEPPRAPSLTGAGTGDCVWVADETWKYAELDSDKAIYLRIPVGTDMYPKFPVS